MPITSTSKKEDVKQFQGNLLILGYNPGPVDGLLGSKTTGAAHDFADDQKITTKFNGEIPDSVIFKAKELAAIKQNVLITPPANFLDLTATSWPAPRKFTRPWKDVTGITLHQTGVCFLGSKPKRWSYFENVELINGQKVATVSSLKAHVGVTQKGEIYQVHPFNSFIWSAQGLSHKTISIEIDGAFLGIEGDPSTNPGVKKIATPTQEQVEATKELIRYIKKILETNGSELKNIFTHRQATNTRDPDPGSFVVQNIMIPMMQELNLSDGGKGWVVPGSKGKPIPEAWNPAYTGIKY